MLQLYAGSSLTAKSVCVTCFHICETFGGSPNLKKWVMPPGVKYIGGYKRHLRRHLPKAPGAPEFLFVETPVFERHSRVTRRIPVAPVHEVLEAEMNTGKVPALADCNFEWSKAFQEHPKRFLENDDRPVYPLAVYVDAVKYTRQNSAGKCDSAIGIWTYNLASQARHLVSILSKRQQCRCGCKGHCSLWPVLDAIAFCLEAAADGVRPETQVDGLPWPDGSKLAWLRATSPRLKNRYVVCMVKGDWAEYNSTFSLPSWACFNVGCMFCKADRDGRADFPGVSTHGHSWGALPATWYEDACARCEITVHVKTEIVRSALIDDGGLAWDLRKNAQGMVLKRDVRILNLRAKGRLEPGPELKIISDIFECALPVTVKFGRIHRDGYGRLEDRLSHRCPLFSPKTGINVSHLCTDVLHTVYLGVYSKWIAEVISAVVESNFFQVNGPIDKVRGITARRLTADMHSFWQSLGPSIKSRLSMLTPHMMGERSTPDFKAEAAETGDIGVRFHETGRNQD